MSAEELGRRAREALEQVDAALDGRCGHCGNPIPPAGPSAYYCGQDCQEAYYTTRSAPPPPPARRAPRDPMRPQTTGVGGGEHFLPAVRWCPTCLHKGPAPPMRLSGPCDWCGAALPFLRYTVERYDPRPLTVLWVQWGAQERHARCHWGASVEDMALLFDNLEETLVRDRHRREQERRDAELAEWWRQDRAYFHYRQRYIIDQCIASQVVDPRSLLRISVV